MKKTFCLLLACLLVCTNAFAATATANQDLAFRTGPNTKYTELYTLPQSTTVTPLAFEDGNNITWVLCEFMHEGKLAWGYTGLKRLNIQGNVPQAVNFGSCYFGISGAPIYAGPDSTSELRTVLTRDTMLMGLQLRDMCGESSLEEYRELGYLYLYFPEEYAFVEYYDAELMQPSRGWIPIQYIDVVGVSAATANKDTALYSAEDYSELGTLCEHEIVADFSFMVSEDEQPLARISYIDKETGLYDHYYVQRKDLIIY